MADITVKFADGKEHVYSGVPDDVTPDQIEQRAMQDFQGAKIAHLDRVAAQSTQQAEPARQPTLLERFKEKQNAGLTDTLKEASWLDRNLAGAGSAAAKTYYGVKQLVKGGTLSPEDQQSVKDWNQIEQSAPVGAIAGNVGMMVAPGIGLAGTAGKTAAIGNALLNPNTLGKAAAVGAGYMGVQPTETQGVEGLKDRGIEAAKGAALGAVGQQIGSRAGSYLANKFGARATISAGQIDDAINATLKDSGQSMVDLPPSYINELRAQVAESVRGGKKPDIAALLRKQEFANAGIEPLAGQVTRDPMQYATEQNLRGVSGVGEPLAVRMTNQENALRSKIGEFANGASDRYQAGTQIGDALTSADKAMSGRVSDLYQKARTSSGKDLELPLQGLAQDYAAALRDFGDKIPSGVRNNLDDLGLLNGKQNKLYTVEEADRLLKVINANSSTDPAVNTALATLRNSVKRSVTDVDASGGVYAPAVQAAAARFKMHDMLPALQQAARGEINADKFVATQIVGAKPESVKALAGMLKMSNPDAYNQAKAQVGEYLRKSAYGLDGQLTAGDGAFRPAGFAKALDSLGERLSAFYTPEEITQLKQLSRVGSYMNTSPAKAAVSSSNSGVPVQNALMHLLGKAVPYSDTVVGLAKGATSSVKNNSAVKRSLAADVPMSKLELLAGEKQKYKNLLTRLTVPLAIGSGQ
jgi:hypothetical protein